ncbi:MAG: hypothetical protein LUG12_12485 [Erysipelotrichaceae bacterium]|nr:hypothetical protein [Erysipelotrichaceae bacterium]
MAIKQYTLTKSLRNRYKTIISLVEEELKTTIVALRLSKKGNYIIIGESEEICISKKYVDQNVKRLFNIIIGIKTNNYHIKPIIETMPPVDISLTLSMNSDLK